METNHKKIFFGKCNKNFSKETSVGAVINNGLTKKSTFSPLVSANQHIDVFRNLVLRDLEQIIPKIEMKPKHIVDDIEQVAKRTNIQQIMGEGW